MKKKLIKGFIALVSIILSYVIIDNMFFPTSISYDEKDYNQMITYKGNTLTVNYSMVNLFLEQINGYIDYGNDLSNIYNDLIDKFYNDKNIKMYDEGNYKVLEVKYGREQARELFKGFIDPTLIEKDMKIKILLNKNWNLKNISIAKINKKLNRDDAMRSEIVKLAQKQVGVYGSRYWKWWGARGRMEWCCVFISWLGYQTDTLNINIPRFAAVSQGINFFKSKNQLKYASKYTPKPGDVVFFDFPSDYLVDHVGLVEKVENGIVYTIEGNANSDYVKRKEYAIGSPYLYAYGVPNFEETN